MTKNLFEIASEIVQTQVSQTNMTSAEIAESLRQVFSTLRELQQAESGEIAPPQALEPAKALTPQDSIQNDKVICLECGAEMKQLTKLHLISHGLTAKEYKKKHGFTLGTPLAAKSLTRARSRAAKKRGVPENLKKYMEAKRQAKAGASKPAATETVGVSKPKRTRAKKKSV